MQRLRSNRGLLAALPSVVVVNAQWPRHPFTIAQQPQRSQIPRAAPGCSMQGIYQYRPVFLSGFNYNFERVKAVFRYHCQPKTRDRGNHH